MTVSHLGHSVLATRIATGPPRVRPYPARLRASAAATSSVLTRTPAGTPSQIATSARPCDSPAVSQRNMVTILLGVACDAEFDAAAQPARQPARDPVGGAVHGQLP